MAAGDHHDRSLRLRLYGAFFISPADYQQGETVRIMYIHVPAAWLSLFVYAGMAISALGTLVFRHPMADVAQKAAAPVGAGFTLICLLTGRSGASRCGAPGGNGMPA